MIMQLLRKLTLMHGLVLKAQYHPSIMIPNTTFWFKYVYIFL